MLTFCEGQIWTLYDAEAASNGFSFGVVLRVEVDVEGRSDGGVNGTRYVTRTSRVTARSHGKHDWALPDDRDYGEARAFQVLPSICFLNRSADSARHILKSNATAQSLHSSPFIISPTL